MYSYDVALSFAGEDREYVKDIAKKLRAKKLKVFYDEFEESNLLGKDLYQYLHYIYKESSYFCVIFVSENYMKKAWTRNVELKAAQNRAFLESNEYILPIKLDSNASIPGLPDTIGYMDAKQRTPSQIVKAIYEKVYLVKPTKDEELHRTTIIYKFVFETFDFIVNRYCCFGRGSKINEVAFLIVLIDQYKDFLLEHAHEINADLYIFLVQLLKELETYIKNDELINFFHAANVKYRANVLEQLRIAFEKSNFSKNFDFWYYIYQDSKLNNRDGLLTDAIKDIIEELKKLKASPSCASDYLNRIAPMMFFEEYLAGEANSVLIEKVFVDEDLKELQLLFDDSDSVEFDD